MGTIVSGDQFINDESVRQRLQNDFQADAVAAPLILLTYVVKSAVLFWISLSALMLTVAPSFSIAVAALQNMTPSAYRARMSGLLVSFVSVTGMILGPPAVGAIVDFGLHDSSKLGVALTLLNAASFAIILPALFIAYRLASRRNRAEAADSVRVTRGERDEPGRRSSMQQR